MKKILFSLIFLIATSFSLNAQSYLQMKDGRRIAFKRISIKNNKIRLKTSNEPSVGIDINDAEKYYSEESKTFFFIKRVTESEVSLGIRLDKKNDFEFVERIIEGEINVYQKKEAHSIVPNNSGVTNHTLTPDRSSTYLFLEKGELYFNVLKTNTIGQNKKDKFASFKSLVQDDSTTLKWLNSKDYRHNYNLILRTVNDYNNRKNPPIIVPDTTVTKVVFFRKIRRENEKSAEFFVDNQPYSLLPGEKLNIDLPGNNNIVCMSYKSIKRCALIKKLSSEKSYVEISWGKTNKINIEVKDAAYSRKQLSD